MEDLYQHYTAYRFYQCFKEADQHNGKRKNRLKKRKQQYMYIV